MYKILGLLLIVSLAFAFPRQSGYANCPETCKLPNCQCSSTSIPNEIPREKVPQVKLNLFHEVDIF